jgi:protein O-mannosyl-transferase
MLLQSLNRTSVATSVVLVLFCFGVFYPALSNEFVWDDKLFMVEAATYTGSGRLFRSLLEPFSIHQDYYRPIVALSFSIFPASFDHSAAAHHAINIALHSANVVLVYLATLRVYSLISGGAANAKKSVVGAICAALIIAVHPLAFEPVLWISGRFDLALTLFCIAFVLLDLTMRHSVRRTALLTLTYFLAATSKESAVAFPIALIGIHTFIWQSQALNVSWIAYMWRQRAAYIAIFIAGCSYLALRYFVVSHIATQGSELGLANHFGDRLLLASLALIEYFRLVFVPWTTTAPIHPFDPASVTPAWYFIPAAVGGALFSLGIFKVRSGMLWPWVVFVFVAMLLPVLHLLTLSAGGSLIADRYALAPLAMALLVAMPLCVRRVNDMFLSRTFVWALQIVGITILLSWVLLARVTTLVWRDDRTLWAYAFERAPDSRMAAQNHVTGLLRNGDLDQGEKILRKLGETGATSMSALTNLVLIRAIRGDFAEAMDLLGRVDVTKSQKFTNIDKGTYFCTYAQVEEMRSNWSAALEHSVRALEFDRSNATCLVIEVRALHALGLREEAMTKVAELQKSGMPHLVKKLDVLTTSWRVNESSQK